MSNTAFERIITMTITGPAAEGGHIPLSILGEKISALQESLYGAANALEGSKGSPVGKWNKSILSSCTLTLKEFEIGSLKVKSEIPTPQQMDLSPELDLGLQALDGFRQASKAVEKGDALAIQQLMPYPATRGRFLKKIKSLCPEEGEQYNIALGNGKGEMHSILKVRSREFIKNSVFTDSPVKTPRKVKIRGELIEIRIKDERRHIALETSRGEIACNYLPDMEAYISSIPTGSLIEVECMAVIDEKGDVNRAENILDVDIINIPPLFLKKFVFENKRYLLKEEVVGSIENESGLWVYKIPRYNLHSYSRDRKEAFLQLNEEFAFQYDDLYNEIDENLTLDAIELRERMKRDIEKVEEIN
ncbi:MAG: hypothetical protein K8T10_11945 [Candidatus Eremiobacteraeota bacterium]|nr:hypothetical protein [Candidatus Eremiobacteraeota bacterium]